jgi:hypothetical protein
MRIAGKLHSNLAWALGAAIAVCSARGYAADPAAAQEGKRAFKAGVLLLQDPDGAKYDEALVEFRRAYEALGTWKVLGNIGLCALKLERDGEAIEAYEKYLAGGRAEIDKQEREQVDRDLQRLRAQLVKVHIEAPAGTQLSDDRTTTQGSHVGNLYTVTGSTMDLGLHPGHHLLVAKSAQGQARWEVDLAPASSVSHKFELNGAPASAPAAPQAAAPAPQAGSGTPPPSPATGATMDVGADSAGSSASSSRTLGFVSIGVGAVGLGAGVLFTVLRSGKVSESEDLCTGPGGGCPETKRAQIDELDNAAKTNGTLAIVGFAVGAVGLGTGAFLLLKGSSSTSAASARVEPWLGLGSAGVRGTF